jgi:hypothetical protein
MSLVCETGYRKIHDNPDNFVLLIIPALRGRGMSFDLLTPGINWRGSTKKCRRTSEF